MTAAGYRSVTLQVYASGGWHSIVTRTSDAYGRVAFAMRTPYGIRAYRLVQSGNVLLLGYVGPTRSVHGS